MWTVVSSVDGVPKTLQAVVCDTRIVLTKHHNFGDKWTLWIPSMPQDRWALKSTDLEEAKNEAAGTACHKLVCQANIYIECGFQLLEWVKTRAE